MELPKTPDELIEKLSTDEKFFIQSCLSITDRETNKQIPFKLNQVQSWYETKKSDFDFIIKSRKQGLSTRIIASDIWACAFKPAQHAIMVSHDRMHTQLALQERVKPIIQSSLFPLGAVERADHIYFPRTKSRYYIGTAGSKRFGRGSDITRYHLSEYAHYEDPTLITGIEEGCLAGAIGRIETTANGENFCKQDWLKAVAGKSRYKAIFIPWFMDSAYRIKGSRLDGLSEDEMRLIQTYGLDHDQLAWRRAKINAMSRPELFPQEYPSYAEEAFLSSGRMVFDWSSLLQHEAKAQDPQWVGYVRDNGERIDFFPDHNAHLKVWKQPVNRHAYVIGADVAEGIEGGAYSTAFVLDVGTSEQVAEWHGHLSPSEFGDVLYDLGLYYNNALLAPEGWPGPGSVTTAKLKDIGYSRIYKRGSGDHEYGWATDLKTKPLMVSHLYDALRNYQVHIASKELISELRSFIYTDNGKMEPSLGCFSDRVIAAAIAWTISRNLAETINYESPRLRADWSRTQGGAVSIPKWRGPRMGVRN